MMSIFKDSLNINSIVLKKLHFIRITYDWDDPTWISKCNITLNTINLKELDLSMFWNEGILCGKIFKDNIL